MGNVLATAHVPQLQLVQLTVSVDIQGAMARATWLDMTGRSSWGRDLLGMFLHFTSRRLNTKGEGIMQLHLHFIAYMYF
jgi:hypothetical protein